MGVNLELIFAFLDSADPFGEGDLRFDGGSSLSKAVLSSRTLFILLEDLDAVDEAE